MVPENEKLTLENTASFTDIDPINKEQSASLELLSINVTSLFDTNQCTEILNNCIQELWIPVKNIGNEKLHSARRQKLRGDIHGFPFLDIRKVTKDANDRIYDFSLLGIIDQDFPQIFHYSEKNYYNWHIDLNIMASSRKISFIINLSDPKDYQGGDIEFLNTKMESEHTKQQGSCIIFPSFLPYRINPVKSGSKYVIVGHVHGALFR
jgi:predicted 2-oxoglutarate/Fe(II)-dependent dioxygenase YbiX